MTQVWVHGIVCWLSQSALEGAHLLFKFHVIGCVSLMALVKLIVHVESLPHPGSWRLFCKLEAIKRFDYSHHFHAIPCLYILVKCRPVTSACVIRGEEL